jgi:hypothetical protein
MAMLKEGVSHAHAIQRFVYILSREGELVHSASDAIDILRDMIANEMRHSTDDWWRECANNYADCNPHQPGWEAKRAIDCLDWASDEWKAKLYKALHAKKLVLGVGIWPPVKEFLNQSIRPHPECDKCTLCLYGDGTDGPETICQSYVTDRCGSRDPGKSRACCLWEHSVSITNIVTILMDNFEISDRVGRKYAKRYMDDCLSAFPLGQPTNDKHSYKVTLYREVSDAYKAVDRHGNLSGAASHYFVYMGYRLV